MSLEIRINEKRITTEKYQRIIDAAIKVFSKKGFYNSKVSDVARVADVADGTIYLYFKNKDDLLVSIFENCIDDFFRTTSEHLKKIDDPREQLREFIRLHLMRVQNNPDLAQVMQIELRSSNKFMTQYKAEKFFHYLSLVEEIIVTGQNKNFFRRDIIPAIAKRIVFGAIDEIALEWVLMKKKRYSVEEATQQVCDMILSGIEKKKTSENILEQEGL